MGRFSASYPARFSSAGISGEINGVKNGTRIFPLAVPLAEIGRRHERPRRGLRSVPEFQALDQRADTQLQRSGIAHVVDFQQREAFPVPSQQGRALRRSAERPGRSRKRSVRRTARSDPAGSPMRSPENAVGIGPLRHIMSVGGRNIFAAHDIVRNDVDAHPRDHLRDFMLDERIGMVGPAGYEKRQPAASRLRRRIPPLSSLSCRAKARCSSSARRKAVRIFRRATPSETR